MHSASLSTSALLHGWNHTAPAAVPDDLTGRAWHRLLDAELLLAQGRLTEAHRRLDPPFDSPTLPPHLRIVFLMDSAALALMTGNRQELRQVGTELRTCGALGEALWVEALLAELDGDLPSAATLYLAASTEQCRPHPATRAASLVCGAQLSDYLGEKERAARLISEAVDATEPLRDASPFLGWSLHGTRVGVLLAEVPTPSPWGEELRTACADRPGVATKFRSLVATEPELRTVVEPMVVPSLSPREHEVLAELARGSTYSGIAANLFVSENTVKTHISSLYAKLAVGRRSDALAVARKLHLV